MAVIAGLAAFAVIAVGAERLQIVRCQPQVPVIGERLDVIDIHARAVFRGAAAEDARRLLGKMRIAQPFPFRCFIKPLHESG